MRSWRSSSRENAEKASSSHLRERSITQRCVVLGIDWCHIIRTDNEETKKSRKGQGESAFITLWRRISGPGFSEGNTRPDRCCPTKPSGATSHGVSRTAVREAIKMLAAKGLIVSRPKIGSRVRPRDVWNLLDRDVLAGYCGGVGPAPFPQRTCSRCARCWSRRWPRSPPLNHTDLQLAAIESAYMGMVDSTNTTDWNTNDVQVPPRGAGRGRQ